MTDTGDDLNKILSNAATRRQYDAHSYFEPPASLVAFGRKVEAWFDEHDQPVSLGRFKQMFINFGVAKLTNRGYIEKVVPKLYTDSEFEVLLETLGYEISDNEEDFDEYHDNPLRVLVVASDSWDDTEFTSMSKVLRQLPPSTTIVTNARSDGDVHAARIWEQYGEVDDVTDSKRMFAGVDFVLMFHESPRESEHGIKIARRAKERGLGVKVIDGTKKVELDVSALAGR